MAINPVSKLKAFKSGAGKAITSLTKGGLKTAEWQDTLASGVDERVNRLLTERGLDTADPKAAAQLATEYRDVLKQGVNDSLKSILLNEASGQVAKGLHLAFGTPGGDLGQKAMEKGLQGGANILFPDQKD